MKEIRLTIQPYPKQVRFFLAQNRFIAYGGSRGGGKSWAARAKCVLLALRYRGIQILLLRRTLPELKENHLLPLLRMLEGIARYRAEERAFLFPNGSRIRLGYCDGERDVLQYQGQAYDVIFLEEATHFTEFQFQALLECNRSSGAMEERFRPRMYFTCNPGGVGHGWVKRLFIDRDYRGAEDPQNYAFIPSTVYDNAYLMEHNPEYVRDLESLPEMRRRAMLYGDWDAFLGQYFREFNRDRHVCAPFPIPRHWRVYRAMDYGLDMLACLWIAVDGQRNAYVFRELCEPDLPIGQAAGRILAATREPVYLTLAPRDLWSRSQESGRSKADMFREGGLTFAPASSDREAGWLAVKELLNRPGGLRIFDTCRELIRCLPTLQCDRYRPTDVATEPHGLTHAPDALRYFAVSWIQPARQDSDPDPFAPEESPEESFIRYGRD